MEETAIFELITRHKKMTYLQKNIVYNFKTYIFTSCVILIYTNVKLFIDQWLWSCK